MFDLHCHALPGLDDGARTWSEALAIASELSDRGVRVMALTPHFHPETWPQDPAGILALTEEFRGRLQAAGILLEVLAGAEVTLDPAVPRWVVAGLAPTLGDAGRHLLVSLPQAEVPLWARQVLFELQLLGVRPILAHPERNAAIAQNPALAYVMATHGALLQVDAGSLVGRYGPAARRAAEILVRQGLVHCLGSDAHRPGHAGADWAAAVGRLERLAGARGMERITRSTPALVVSGARVPAEPTARRRRSSAARRALP